VKTDEFYLPYSVSVGLWYAMSVGFAMWAVFMLARLSCPTPCRERGAGGYATTIPFYVCLGGIGFSLGRGQINLLLVAMFAASFATAVRGRRTASGLARHGHRIQVIPAFLLLFPFMRRDWRAGIGVVAALVIGLGAIPFAVFGPQKAMAQHESSSRTSFSRARRVKAITRWARIDRDDGNR